MTFLSGFPFPAGVAEARKVRLTNSSNEPLIGGLTSAIDVLPVEGASNQFFTLEFSTNQLAAAPGRLSLFQRADAPPVILVANLTRPQAWRAAL